MHCFYIYILYMHVCIGPGNNVTTMATTVVTDTNRTTVTDQITVHVTGKFFQRVPLSE